MFILSTQDYFFKLGNKTPEASGFAEPKPLFWSRPTFVLLSAANPAGEDKLASEDKEFAQWKDKYDRSKKTTTRTGKKLPPIMQQEMYEKMICCNWQHYWAWTHS